MNAPQILLKTNTKPNRTVKLTEFADMIDHDISAETLLLDSADISSRDRYTLEQFALWMQFQPEYALFPDFDRYQKYLLGRGYKHSTTLKVIGIIRGRYQEIVRERDVLFTLVKGGNSWFERKQVVDELVTRSQNAMHPRRMRRRSEVIQDQPDSEHRRLTREQSQMLLRAPGLVTLKGLRDTAMIALALTTGIRASELTGLQVQDLRRKFDGETALHVRHGKGNKTRLIPYGDMIWSLDFVDKWLESANVQSGAVFRRLYWFAREQKHRVKPNEKGMHSGALKEVLEVYPIEIEDKLVTINPHDLRRTYALRCYDAGMDLTRIQRNLGHTRADTTLVYLGQLDGNLRRPPDAYNRPNDLIQQLKIGETS